MPAPPRDPEQVEALGLQAPARLPATTRMGAVCLTVADLAASIEYYQHAVGLRLHGREGERARLGTGGEDLLLLVERRGARPVRGHCGLYHFALLLPQRADLAGWLAHAAREQVPLVGMSDHFVSEAIYLTDPDGHGIEIYWDRPRELWEGRVAERMTTLPLDTASLLAELADPQNEPFGGLPSKTTMGHVHLCVADIPATVAFYRDLLGLGLMASLGSHAAFLSAGGYHHHLGANTWESAGAGQPPGGSAALGYASIVLLSELERDRALARLAKAGVEPQPSENGPLVHDPSGNPILLVATTAQA